MNELCGPFTRRIVGLLAGLSLCCLLAPGSGAALGGAKDDMTKLLGRDLVTPELILREMQLYTSARVPVMPVFKTRAEWEQQAAAWRSAILERVVYRGQATVWRDARTRVEWLETIAGGPGYRIKKLRYEALPGVWIPALLYEPEKMAGLVPVHLTLHGHARPQGMTVPYAQVRSINLAKRGMLVLNIEWLATGQLRTDNWDHDRMRQLDLCGTSGLAPFYLCMKRGLDVLLGLEHADPARVAVSGESGGGWQSIFLGALDTRVKLLNPVAGYGSFRTGIWYFDVGDSEQSPCDLATIADYTHMTALMAPRPTLLTYNARDNCCFVAAQALPPLLEAAGPIFLLHGKAKNLRSHVNYDPGNHNYEQDNRQAFYRMIGDHFFAGDRSFDARELPCRDEVKEQKALAVDMPNEQQDFQTLALALCKTLPREPALPTAAAAIPQWQEASRAKLRQIVRAVNYSVKAVPAGSEAQADLQASYWWLQMDGAWTVPATELVERASAKPPRRTVLLLADEGRRSLPAEAKRLLDQGCRVLALDPLGLGESALIRRAQPARYRSEYYHVVDAVGARPLGLQASQVAAAARWCRANHPAEEVTIVAVGPRASMCALVAAALEEKAIARIELHQSLGTLKEVIERNWTAAQTPEMFCFGLLEAFDIKQICALVAPRPAEFVDASPRTRLELSGLREWYALLGSAFEPSK